jgi:hypothetical protein
VPEEKPYNPFVIDENDIGGEWLRQPKLMRKAGHTEADAQHEYNQAKSRVEVVRARLWLAIRKNPLAYELREKPTEEDVKAAVFAHDDYQQAVREMNDAKHYADLCSADTVAMIDRRKALERRVELLSLNYFSEKEPHAPTEEARDLIDSHRKHSIRGGGDDSH